MTSTDRPLLWHRGVLTGTGVKRLKIEVAAQGAHGSCKLAIIYHLNSLSESLNGWANTTFCSAMQLQLGRIAAFDNTRKVLPSTINVESCILHHI